MMALAVPPFERIESGFTISTDPARLDLDAIHRFLSRDSYWCRGIPREVVARSLANALCFGLYAPTFEMAAGSAAAGAQAGLARVITDYATYGYVADVFVLPQWRGRGLSKRLMAAIAEHPALQGFRRWTLATRDAHGLYAQFGFKPFSRPEWQMERFNPSVYGDPP